MNVPHSRSARIALLCGLITTFAIVVLWLSAGPWLTALTDQVVALPVPISPVGTLAYDGEGFRVSDLSLTFGAIDNQRSDVDLQTNDSKMIVLVSGGRSFILGPRTNPMDLSGRPDLDFHPERGDVVSLTGTRSLVGWPTPFEVNFMTSTPSWKRYVYYRLVWRKRSGAEVRLLWRYEQDYYKGRGWTEPLMMWNFRTGLLRIDFRP